MCENLEISRQELDTFYIKRSLSNKESSFDNAVAEASFKSIKTEFVYPNAFETLEELETKFRALCGGSTTNDCI